MDKLDNLTKILKESNSRDDFFSILFINKFWFKEVFFKELFKKLISKLFFSIL